MTFSLSCMHSLTCLGGLRSSGRKIAMQMLGTAYCRGTRLCSNGTCGIQCSQQYPTQCGATDQGDSDCANLNGDILNW